MDGSVILERLRGHRRILLLQGPVGPFFAHLARFLIDSGKEVSKVDFNGGDNWFYRLPNAVAFNDDLDRWPAFFDRLLEEKRIDAVVLFGDCRPIHRSAILRAKFRKTAVYVFEEGYVRPNFVTFEYSGANGNSLLPRPTLVPDDMTAHPLSFPKLKPFFSKHVRYAITYHVAGYFSQKRYPYYDHHKPFDIVPEGKRWLRAFGRRYICKWRERKITRLLSGELKKRYFFVPLQVYNDSQIKWHSDFKSMRAFITQVMQSFSQNAPEDVFLVFKHHPLDRGHRDYSPQIARQAKHFGVEGRVFYIHDQHVPTLLKNALGTVTVNSTVGLSSLYHNTPLKVMGRAVYDFQGITFQDDLDVFWHDPKPPERRLFHFFRNYLIRFTQVHGSFYSNESIVGNNPVQPVIDMDWLEDASLDELAA